MSNLGDMNVDAFLSNGGGVNAVAEKLGVDRSTVYDWKRNKAIPASRVAEVHAKFGIPVEVLLKLTKAPAIRKIAA